MDNLAEKARQVFAKDRYATEASGIKIDTLVADECTHGGVATCSMEIGALHQNARGTVMGGALFTLADLAFAAAANVSPITDERPLEWVSIESSIRYLRPASEGRLNAEARCVKQGKSTCFYTISITDAKGRQIAIVDTVGTKVA